MCCKTVLLQHFVVHTLRSLFVGYVGEIYQTESLSRQVTVTALLTSKSMPHAAQQPAPASAFQLLLLLRDMQQQRYRCCRRRFRSSNSAIAVAADASDAAVGAIATTLNFRVSEPPYLDTCTCARRKHTTYTRSHERIRTRHPPRLRDKLAHSRRMPPLRLAPRAVVAQRPRHASCRLWFKAQKVLKVCRTGRIKAHLRHERGVDTSQRRLERVAIGF